MANFSMDASFSRLKDCVKDEVDALIAVFDNDIRVVVEEHLVFLDVKINPRTGAKTTNFVDAEVRVNISDDEYPDSAPIMSLWSSHGLDEEEIERLKTSIGDSVVIVFNDFPSTPCLYMIIDQLIDIIDRMNSTRKCSICLDYLNRQVAVDLKVLATRTHCNHHFHNSCISKWAIIQSQATPVKEVVDYVRIEAEVAVEVEARRRLKCEVGLERMQVSEEERIILMMMANTATASSSTSLSPDELTRQLRLIRTKITDAKREIKVLTSDLKSITRQVLHAQNRLDSYLVSLQGNDDDEGDDDDNDVVFTCPVCRRNSSLHQLGLYHVHAQHVNDDDSHTPSSVCVGLQELPDWCKDFVRQTQLHQARLSSCRTSELAKIT